MGRMSANQAIRLVEMRVALAYHLSHNHYPPIPDKMLEVCLEAIANANAGEWDKTVTLPSGILWRGEASCPTHSVIEYAHLETFLDDDNE
jgi:hypothetical protein